MNALPPNQQSRARSQRAPAAVVFGEALVDRFTHGPVAGGAPFNLTRSLAALGVATTMITRIGQADDDGARVLASAHRFGLAEAGLQRDATHPTGAVTVLERHGGHAFRIHADAAWDHIELGPARRVWREARPRVVCYGTLAQRSATSRATLQTLLQETEALRFLDLNLRGGQDNRPLAKAGLEQADWVKVNEDELGHLIVWFVPQADATAPHGSPQRGAAVAQLIRSFGLQLLIVTRAECGYAAYDREGELASGEGVKLACVADTVGAGDGFAAAVIALHLAGRPLPEALSLANRYAAALCAEHGAIPEDDEFFQSWRWTLGLDLPLPQAA